jgi:hypothetical protein
MRNSWWLILKSTSYKNDENHQVAANCWMRSLSRIMEGRTAYRPITSNHLMARGWGVKISLWAVLDGLLFLHNVSRWRRVGVHLGWPDWPTGVETVETVLSDQRLPGAWDIPKLDGTHVLVCRPGRNSITGEWNRLLRDELIVTK